MALDVRPAAHAGAETPAKSRQRGLMRVRTSTVRTSVDRLREGGTFSASSLNRRRTEEAARRRGRSSSSFARAYANHALRAGCARRRQECRRRVARLSEAAASPSSRLKSPPATAHLPQRRRVGGDPESRVQHRPHSSRAPSEWLDAAVREMPSASEREAHKTGSRRIRNSGKFCGARIAAAIQFSKCQA